MNEETKNRTVFIPLTDRQVERLAEISAGQSMSIGELLGAFIGDLTGIYANGSDEMNLAEAWLKRCAFDMFEPETFLKFLYDHGELNTAKECMEEILMLQEETQEDPEEVRNELRGFIHSEEETLQNLYSDYCEAVSNPEDVAEAFDSVRSYTKELCRLLRSGRKDTKA